MNVNKYKELNIELEFCLRRYCYKRKNISLSGGVIFPVKEVYCRLFFNFFDGNFFGVSDNYGENIFYDLASLTKVLVTIPSVLFLLDHAVFFEDYPISYWYPNSCSRNSCDITLLELINHISGLPAHRLYANFFKKNGRKDFFRCVEQSILSEKIVSKRQIYSDLGYILLGRIIEKETGMNLDYFWNKMIARPLSLDNILFYPTGKENLYFVRTSDILRGIVHDDNCRFLGGIAGHAGLFGNVSGVLTFCEKILNIYYDRLNLAPFSPQFFRDCISKKEGDRRFGFDTPAKKDSSCGNFFSDLTIGHLGFTGTSLWIDLKQEIGIVLLTNRVIYEDSVEWIKKLRPEIHNIIMKHIVQQ